MYKNTAIDLKIQNITIIEWHYVTTLLYPLWQNKDVIQQKRPLPVNIKAPEPAIPAKVSLCSYTVTHSQYPLRATREMVHARQILLHSQISDNLNSVLCDEMLKFNLERLILKAIRLNVA